MKVDSRSCARAKVLGIIAATLVLSGCAMAMLEGASRSGGQSGSGASSGSSSPATKPATGKPAASAAADNAVSTAVRSRLGGNAALRPLKLSVDTHDGVVTLRGQVNNVEQRNAAQLEARAVSGVKAVKNELTVRTN